MEGYIPRYLLLTIEIRSQSTLEGRAAYIKYLDSTLRMTKICEELGASYQQSLRRLDALKNNRPWAGVGRALFYNSMMIDDIQKEIAKDYKKGDCTNYSKLRALLDIDYRNEIDQMTLEARENIHQI